MATAASIKVVKRFTYKGVTKDWSNRYHFDGSNPADSTHWTTLSDAVTAAEKAIFRAEQTIIETVGYNSGSDIPVFSKTYSLTGTLSITTFQVMPGDVAALVRYSTASRTSKNHPLYLFNYWHGVNAAAGGDPDTLIAGQRTAMQTYAAAWITGFSDGGVTHHRCGPNGDLATGQLVASYLTHRDFPRS